MDATPRRWFAVIGCLVAACNLTQPQPSVEPTSVASTPLASAPTTRRFDAPGISFDYPAEWVDQTAVVGESQGLGRRTVAAFALGMSLCEGNKEPEPLGPGHGGCLVRPARPRQLRFDVVELMALYPGSRQDTGGAWLSGGVATQRWSIESPEGGEYRLTLQTRSDTYPDRFSPFQESMRDLITGVRTEAWQSPPPATNGWVHQSTPYGFSFDYPASWSRYFPFPWTRDQMLATVASKPVLEPPACPTGSTCRLFDTRPGAVVIEFAFIRPRTFLSPNWEEATESIGGQPAFTSTYPTKPETTGVDAIDTWHVRVPDGPTWGLTINVLLREPNLDGGRAAAQAVMDTLQINPAGPAD